MVVGDRQAQCMRARAKDSAINYADGPEGSAHSLRPAGTGNSMARPLLGMGL